MTDLLNVVLPTFLIIFIGFIFGKIKKWDLSVISEIVIYIGLPALVLTSMLEKKIDLLNAAKIWGSAVLIIFGCMIVAWIVFRIIRQKHSGLYLPIGIMNAVNIPFPIIYLTYGHEGLYAATLFMIASGVITYSVGIYIASGKDWKGSLKEVLKIPPIYAAVLGLLLNMFEVDVPEVITTPLNIIGLMGVRRQNKFERWYQNLREPIFLLKDCYLSFSYLILKSYQSPYHILLLTDLKGCFYCLQNLCTKFL